MRLKSILFCISTAVRLGAAQSPPGVFPQVLNLLLVNYGGSFIKQGQVVSQTDTQNPPELALPAGQTSVTGSYIMVMVDIDEGGAAFKKKRDSINQPDDAQHANGADTYLQAMVQDYIIDAGNSNDGSPVLKSSATGPAAYEDPEPKAPDGHRYMVMLFQQPQGWSLPAPLQDAVNTRTNFDLRAFIAGAGLDVPVYSNWMIISPQGRALETSTAAKVTELPDGGPTITIPVTTTVPVSGSPSLISSESQPTGADGNPVEAGVSTFYTTGFIGFTLRTSVEISSYTVVAELPGGSYTLLPTVTTVTTTRAFSGVSHISLTTYAVASTETLTEAAVLNGKATTWTTTTTAVGFTTSAASVNHAAVTPAPAYKAAGAAMVGLVGVALGAI